MKLPLAWHRNRGAGHEGAHSPLGWGALQPGCPLEEAAGSRPHWSPRKGLSSCQNSPPPPASPVQFHLSLQELERHDSYTAECRWVTARLWQCWAEEGRAAEDKRRDWKGASDGIQSMHSLHRLPVILIRTSRAGFVGWHGHVPLCAFQSVSLQMGVLSAFAFISLI